MSISSITSTVAITSALLKAYSKGNRKTRTILVVAGIFLVLFIIMMIVHQFIFSNSILLSIGIVAGAIALIIALGVVVYQEALEETETKLEIEEVKQRVRDNPNEPVAAWELAQIKLEHYLNRNLKQVKSVFVWTIIIMIVGFIIIGYGIFKVYQTEDNFSSSIVTVVSGLLIEFIGATFLVIYKSTMEQAKGYVTVLERINAVGMSMQVLESIASDDKLQNETKADLAKKLLELYSIK